MESICSLSVARLFTLLGELSSQFWVFYLPSSLLAKLIIRLSDTFSHQSYPSSFKIFKYDCPCVSNKFYFHLVLISDKIKQKYHVLAGKCIIIIPEDTAHNHCKLEGLEGFNLQGNRQRRETASAGFSLIYVRYGLNQNLILIMSKSWK